MALYMWRSAAVLCVCVCVCVHWSAVWAQTAWHRCIRQVVAHWSSCPSLHTQLSAATSQPCCGALSYLLLACPCWLMYAVMAGVTTSVTTRLLAKSLGRVEVPAPMQDMHTRTATHTQLPKEECSVDLLGLRLRCSWLRVCERRAYMRVSCTIC